VYRTTRNTIYITRGDSAELTLTIKDTDGESYDFSNDTVLFTVKTSVNTTDIIMQKTVTAAGIITIDPEDTESLDYGKYFFDVEVTKQNGEVCTVIAPISGKTPNFIVTEEVTF